MTALFPFCRGFHLLDPYDGNRVIAKGTLAILYPMDSCIVANPLDEEGLTLTAVGIFPWVFWYVAYIYKVQTRVPTYSPGLLKLFYRGG